jgi:hypothetical protein
VEAVRSEKYSEVSDWEVTLCKPSKGAAAVVAKANEQFLVVGQVIEILPHPNLGKRASIGDLGWSPAEVEFNDLQQQFEAEEILEKVGGRKKFDPPNNVKFSLSGVSFVTLDSPFLTLDLKRTDYFTVRSVLSALAAKPELRIELGAVDPASNRIPHSLCLHYVVRFSGGEVLCMRRDPRSAYHGRLWSFSGEEQLSASDFNYGSPGLSLFQRAFCEEVLTLRDESPLGERWDIASSIVEDMSIWSVFIEEEIFNFSLLGLYQLKMSVTEFVSNYTRLASRGTGSRDREGDLFVVSQDMLKALLFDGECSAQALFANEAQTVREENLHPTSRYRIFRLLRAVYRRPLKPETESDSRLRPTRRLS